MGRHNATDGASVRPLVAEGLARRGGAAESHPTVADQAQQSDEVGWPAPPNKGHGLGWPGDLSTDGENQARDEARRPRGWRRLFGTSSAA